MLNFISITFTYLKVGYIQKNRALMESKLPIISDSILHPMSGSSKRTLDCNFTFRIQHHLL